VRAFTNRKGVHIFRGLPGLRDIENSEGDAESWAAVSEKRPFVVEVKDDRHRYLPVKLNVDAPVKGLYRWEHETLASPPAPESAVPLYSAPSRPVLAAMAVVRAELRDGVSGGPAAWTLVEGLIDGNLQGRGISDDKGRLLLMFPFPEPKEHSGSPPLASPPRGSPIRLVDRTWSLQLRAYYSPSTPAPEIPDLANVFEQAEATLWFSLSPSTQLGVQTLQYGRELVLASQSRSELWITPLSSP
jgi:hypothetical protein